MTQLGRPFSEEYAAVIAALRARVLEGVEQPARPVRFTFEGPGGTYRLPEAPYAVTRVVGLLGGSPREFVPDKDFRLSGDRVVWLQGGEWPDERSRFEVEYTYRERPSGLTDFTPGSVVGTLVHAVARQMKQIYDQMDEAYRRAFIDEASGVALDNVVALLGVVRNPALKATGEVTFFLRGAPRAPVVVPFDTRVADENGHAYRTTAEGTILAEEADELVAEEGGVLRTGRRIGTLVGIWDGLSDEAPALRPASYTAFGDDERTITLAEGVRPKDKALVRYKPKSVTVPVEATEPGPESNVNAGAIVVMPTPPRGIQGVLNEEPVGGGTLAEPDDQLRERAKHALERSGNATMNAIKYAVLDVDRVEGVEVLDHSVDGLIPLGEVRVRYSGGDRSEVERVIESTRAAGVLALVEEIVRVSISGTFYLIPEPDAPAGAAPAFLRSAVEAMEGLTIGAPLSVRRLSALAFGVTGLADVAEAQLEHDRAGDQDREVSDPFPVARTELVRPNDAALEAVLVGAIEVRAGRRAGNDRNELDLRLLDADGGPIVWRGFSLGVSVTLLGRLKVAQESPPEHLTTLSPPPTVTWTGSDTATLTIPDSAVENYDPDRHLPAVSVTLSAAAYPGVRGAQTTITLPGTA